MTKATFFIFININAEVIPGMKVILIYGVKHSIKEHAPWLFAYYNKWIYQDYNLLH